MSYTALGPLVITSKLYRFDRTAKLLPNPDDITDAHVEQYRRDGFLAVAGVLTPGEVDTARVALSDLIAGKVPDSLDTVQYEPGTDLARLTTIEERTRHVRKVMRFVRCEARLRAIAAAPRLLNVCRRLLGHDVNLMQDMALLKPAHHGTEKPWHQDAAYFTYEPSDGVIGTWTALDPATAENGCMHVIPGSHLAGPRPHYHDRDCQLPDEAVSVEEDVMAPLPPGATLFFNALLHHGTPPNQSAAQRWALQFHYAGVHCRKIDRARHGEMFNDPLGYAACPGGRRIEEKA